MDRLKQIYKESYIDPFDYKYSGGWKLDYSDSEVEENKKNYDKPQQNTEKK